MVASHGHTKGGVSPGKSRGTPTYMSWLAMRNRCHNPNNEKFATYGARGISVCNHWRHSFENFLFDMGERPDGTTLDRIDSLGNYTPTNCRWATPKQQAENSDNFSKGWKRNNTHCPSGHEFTEENTAWRLDKQAGKKYRKCLTCDRERARRNRSRA